MACSHLPVQDEKSKTDNAKKEANRRARDPGPVSWPWPAEQDRACLQGWGPAATAEIKLGILSAPLTNNYPQKREVD